MTSTATVDRRATTSAAGEARCLVVTWEHPGTRVISPVGFLTFDGVTYAFVYVPQALEAEGFRPLLGFPDLHRRYESDQLFPLFAQRVMDLHRADYARYVDRLGLDPRELDPWEQLARSEGSRHGDTIQLLPSPWRDVEGVWRCRTLVHGLRWMPVRETMVDGVARLVTGVELEATLASLRPGDGLALVLEPNNLHNPRAVIVTDRARTLLGYLPDLLTEGYHRLSQTVRVTARVVRVNGPDAPAHLRLWSSWRRTRSTSSSSSVAAGGRSWPDQGLLRSHMLRGPSGS